MPKRCLTLAKLCFLIVSLIVIALNRVDAQQRLTAVTPLSQIAIQLTFDAPLDPEFAKAAENYHITPEGEVEWVTLGAQSKKALLSTTPLEIGKTYAVTVKGVAETAHEFTLPEIAEVTFGESDGATFSGVAKDTFFIVDPENKKARNYSAGGETFLRCTPEGSAAFIAFEIFDEFDEIGITDGSSILEATITLHAELVESKSPQTLIFRRVLLPWHEGTQKSQEAEKNDLTYNSSLHKNLPWNKPPAQAMLEGVDGDEPSDFNGSEDVAHRIDGTLTVEESGACLIRGELVTEAFRFWLENPDYNYGYLLALRDGGGTVQFASKEHPNPELRPGLKIRYKTAVNLDER